MILHVNYVPQPRTAAASGLLATLFALLEEGRVPPDLLTRLRVHLDWIQYRQNFREAVMVRRAVTGHSYEQALPGGKSDANHPDAVADSVTEFWSLLRELEAKNQLPPELFVLEIGVGSGTRAGLWLDRFRTLDQERGSGYYPRVRFLLSDYSLPLLDRAEAAVRTHRDVISLVPLDALNPYKTLSFLRYKILQVHLTNVYDTLPTDELVRVGDRFYLVQTRAYFPPEDAGRISEMFDIPMDELPRTIAKFLEVGPDYFPDRARGVAFWQTAWAAIRLQERLVGLDELSDSALPVGLHLAHLEDLLGGAAGGVRFHLSSGAVVSFLNTLPLLHPRGILQVQDIFVTSFEQYRLGFRGPGKLDGSVLNWVNGALLSEVGARTGYAVDFIPFRYRPGSLTSILYTSQRE